MNICFGMLNNITMSNTAVNNVNIKSFAMSKFERIIIFMTIDTFDISMRRSIKFTKLTAVFAIVMLLSNPKQIFMPGY
jgi:hypothetical protein